MAHHIDIRIDGVTKLSHFVQEVPAFHIDGKDVVVKATLVEEHPDHDVPALNYGEIMQRLGSENPSDPVEQAQYNLRPATGNDPQAEEIRSQPQQDPQSERGDASGAEIAAQREEDTEAQKVDAQGDEGEDKPKRRGGRRRSGSGEDD